ncbi:MAG: hypothetical protein Fur006_07860 [Coleofasciculaceae cyanobacterium]
MLLASPNPETYSYPTAIRVIARLKLRQGRVTNVILQLERKYFMSGNITLFSGYSQKENRTTNYCLLMLKMLYEENPKFLSEVISSLTDEQVGDYVGVKFTQQQRRALSIPDGLIRQRPFTIYIETKQYDWFYDDQLERHLEELNQEEGLKILIALGNFEYLSETRFQKIDKLCRNIYGNSIVFAAVAFEDFVAAIQAIQLSKNVADAVKDFKGYLDEQGLLPTWQNYLDVVNCARLAHEIIEGGAYICPAEGGNYNHSRCKYFGLYREKRVEYVALIRAVVDVISDTTASLRWKNTEETDAELIQNAKSILQKFRPRDYPHRVFVLSKVYKTNFVKDTKGGMFESKRYFDISNLGVKSAEELAKALEGKTWTNYKSKITPSTLP